MTSIYNNTVADYYSFVFTDLSDERTKDWFLLKSPMPGLTIIAAYLYFVTTWGPRYMKHRKPFELKKTLIVYNFLQVCLSVWLVFEVFDGLWLKPNFSFKCYGMDWSRSPESMRIVRGVYVYFLAKMTELLDTVFFVLRKKDNQITFLHMYHHTAMPLISWNTAKYYPGGHGVFVGGVNSMVHVVMYLYYMLAAFGPRFQKYLWWKKYITTMQMIQFLMVFLHNLQLLIYDCDYPRVSLIFTLPNAGFFYYLFYDFYIKSYNKSKAKLELKEKRANSRKAAGKVTLEELNKRNNNNSELATLPEKKVQ